MYIPGKNRRGGGRLFGTGKNGDFFNCSYAHFSLKFSCEHLFTFQFYAFMPKISKENFGVEMWIGVGGGGQKMWIRIFICFRPF